MNNEPTFKENHYYAFGHNDESMECIEFQSIDQIKAYFFEDEEMNDTELKNFFEESSVDGDSYSAYGLYLFKNNKLELVYSDLIEFKKGYD